MKLNERLREIVRIDRELAAMHPSSSNVIPMKRVVPDTELHRERAAHVKAIQSGAQR